MMDHKLAVEHIRKRKKMVIATLLLLFIAFLESYYLSCMKEVSPLCPLSWIYVVLAAVVLFVLWHYRK